MRRLVALLLCAAALAAPAAPAAPSFPQVIPLPDGFGPEGIAVGRGTTFYVGSLATGAIYRGDLRTGRGAVLVAGASGRTAVGLATDARERVFVAGGQTGKAFVYDGRSGRLLDTFRLATGSGATFVNDVTVTADGAWFTDSQRPVLYRVPIGRAGALGPAVQRLPLGGDYEHVAGLNLNGIDASADGQTLLVVQTATGKLFAVNPRTGTARLVDLGAASVPNGDGILLRGRTLYVVQNRDDRVAVVRLSADLASGTVLRRISDPDFDVPTTIAASGSRLYVVNARFGTEPGPATRYAVVQVG